MFFLKKNGNIFIYKIKISDLFKISKIIINYTNNKIYFLNGEIGSGKTTLIKYFSYFLGFNNVNSPTFSLVNEYYINFSNKIYHFDFYRIKNKKDLTNIDIKYYIYSNNYCFIEWPLKINNLIFKDYLYINVVFNKSFNRNFFIYNI